MGTPHARKTDPFLKALIDKLPDAGEWPESQQLSWLKLMAHAFGFVYGGDVVSLLGSGPKRDQPGHVVQWPPASAASPPAPKKPPPRARYVIDREGLARDTVKGKRLNASDIPDGEILVDERGLDGDMATVTWADNSIGIRSLPPTVAISAA